MLTAKAASVKECGYPGVVRVMLDGSVVGRGGSEARLFSNALARDAFLRIAGASARQTVGSEADSRRDFEFSDYGVAQLFYDMAVELNFVAVLQKPSAIRIVKEEVAVDSCPPRVSEE